MPGVLDVGAASHVPGERPSGASFLAEDCGPGPRTMLNRMSVDDGYLTTLGIGLDAGRAPASSSPPLPEALVNQAAVRRCAWSEPLGRTVRLGDREWRVVGVVEDFHFSSPHRVVPPMFIEANPSRLRALFVRLAPGSTGDAIAKLRTAWQGILPERPFAATPLATRYDAQFDAERNTAGLMLGLSALALLIPALSLGGVAAMAPRHFGREQLPAVVVSQLVAWPLAAYTAKRWLTLFPYHAWPAPWVFAGIAVALASLVALAAAVAAFRARRLAKLAPIPSR